LTGIGPRPDVRDAARRSRRHGVAHRSDDAERSRVARPLRYDLLLRGRRCLALDHKQAGGKDARLAPGRTRRSLIRGVSPGVTERLGLGPEDCLAAIRGSSMGRGHRLGQEGPLARRRDTISNYIALAGAVHAFGRRGQAPTPPLNLIGDFGGGGLYLAFGIVCGILEAQRSGQGSGRRRGDGRRPPASLMTAFFGMMAAGLASHDAAPRPRYRGAFLRGL